MLNASHYTSKLLNCVSRLSNKVLKHKKCKKCWFFRNIKFSKCQKYGLDSTSDKKWGKLNLKQKCKKKCGKIEIEQMSKKCGKFNNCQNCGKFNNCQKCGKWKSNKCKKSAGNSTIVKKVVNENPTNVKTMREIQNCKKCRNSKM